MHSRLFMNSEQRHAKAGSLSLALHALLKRRRIQPTGSALMQTLRAAGKRQRLPG
ncbi:MAG: hypothetical protein WKF73_12355 [Nocardioidaceae bacterium]